MPPVRTEISALIRLAWPVVAAQLGMMLFGLVDIWMVGRLGAREVAAVALAGTGIFGSLILGLGLVMGMDPIVSQAHGAGDGRLIGRAFQRGILVAVLASIPIVGVWLHVDRLLILLGQSHDLAAYAQTYATPQVFCVAPFLVFAAMRQYLQGRGLMVPPLLIILLANVANALLNWTLIFGHFGFEPMGIAGAGIATAVTRTLMMLMLAGLIVWRGLHRGAWVPWDRESFSWPGLRRVLTLGLPISIQFGLEVWAFQASTIIAGHMGEVTTAAHIIVLRMASTAFMVPLGISIASATRVGNLLGAGDPKSAQRAAWVALGMGAGVMGLSALAFIFLPHRLAGFFNRDPQVIAIAVGIFPIAAAFQIFDGTQIVGAGILRGMGTTRPAAAFNLIGFYLLALPVGYALAFPGGMRLRGIWIGLSFGLAVVAICLVGWIAYRGPARLQRLAISPDS